MAYRKVDERFWTSPTIRGLSQDARFLYLYLLTCPHNNALTCYRLPAGYAAADLGWPLERFQETFQELKERPLSNGTAVGLVAHDPETDLVMVRGQLAKEGVANPNVGKALETILKGLPSRSSIYPELADTLERLGRPFLKPLVKGLREQQEQEQEQEQGQEKEQESSLRSDSSPELPLAASGDSPSPVDGQKAVKSTARDGGQTSAPSPAVLSVPLINRDGEYHITQADVDAWQQDFPGIDVMAELRKLRAWNQAEPRRRKSRRGFPRHVVGWLSRAQDKAPATRAPSHSPSPTSPVWDRSL